MREHVSLFREQALDYHRRPKRREPFVEAPAPRALPAALAASAALLALAGLAAKTTVEIGGRATIEPAGASRVRLRVPPGLARAASPGARLSLRSPVGEWTLVVTARVAPDAVEASGVAPDGDEAEVRLTTSALAYLLAAAGPLGEQTR